MSKTRLLHSSERVNGHDFELVKNDDTDIFYQCRGEVMYDDEHDEAPEPSLWKACLELEKQLNKRGFKTYVSHSEKGWCEVGVLTDEKNQ